MWRLADLQWLSVVKKIQKQNILQKRAMRTKNVHKSEVKNIKIA